MPRILPPPSTGTGGGSGHTIHDETDAGLTARTDLNFMGAGLFAQDNSGSTRTEIISGAYYDAIVDTNDTNAKGKGNVYDTIQTAIDDAGNSSIFIRNAGDIVANSTLTAGINAVVTNIPVAALDNFPNAGIVINEKEIIQYSGKSAPTGAGNLTGATRGAKGTAAASHANGLAVETAIAIASTDAVRLIIGEEPENTTIPISLSCQKSDVTFQYLRITTNGTGRRLISQASGIIIFGCVVSFAGKIELESDNAGRDATDAELVEVRAIACTSVPLTISQYAHGMSLTGCRFLSNSGANCVNYAGTSNGPKRMSIVGCKFVNNTNTSYNIAPTSTNTGTFYNSQINGCLFSRFDNGAIALAGRGWNISGNTFDGQTALGLGAASTQIAIKKSGTSGNLQPIVVSGNLFITLDICISALSNGLFTVWSNNFIGQDVLAIFGAYSALTGNMYYDCTIDLGTHSTQTITGGMAIAGSAVINRHVSAPVRGVAMFGYAGAVNGFEEGGEVVGETPHSQSTVALVNGTNNNIAIALNTQVVRITGPTGAFTITGIANGVDGQRLTLINLSGQNMTTNHQDAGSSAGNKITTMTAGTSVGAGNSVAEFIYELNSTSWILLNHAL